VPTTVLLALSACLPPTSLDDSSSGGTTKGPTDSGGSEPEYVDATWNLGKVADDPAAVPTCTEVPSVTWEIREEWRFEIHHFIMNLVAAPQPGDDHAMIFADWARRLTLLDGRDGSLVVGTDVPDNGDDGSTPTVGDADGVPGLEYVTPRWRSTMVYDVSGDAWTTIDRPQEGDDEIVALADIDQDGLAEVVMPSGSYALDGTAIATYPGFVPLGTTSKMVGTNGLLAVDLDGDSFPEAVNALGIWNPLDGKGRTWDVDDSWWFYGATVDVDGVTGILFQGYTGTLDLGWADGSIGWREALELRGYLPALGDADGDGSPDMCTGDANDLLLVDKYANVIHRWNISDGVPWGAASGGCSMADLDADGVFEVLAQSGAGLFIFDGQTGNQLLFDPTYATSARDSAPIVADVDADGSAEIALITGPDAKDMQTIVVLGPAKGRWARTRPVWNQFAYDVTSVRDDGTILGTPLPPSTTYGGVFRAQPAHDGLLADLSTEVTIEYADGDAILSFAVHNLGSLDAPAGTRLALRSFDGGWSELTVTTLKDSIPAGSVVTGSVVLSETDLGSRVVLEALGTGEECDPINDRSAEIRR
jgi:hypothetical protein